MKELFMKVPLPQGAQDLKKQKFHDNFYISPIKKMKYDNTLINILGQKEI